jgi:hypothetical protein
MNLAIVTNTVVAIAWPKVLMSKGPIAPVDYAEAAINDEGNIIFKWTNNAGDGTAKKDDKAILVAWFPDIKHAAFSFSDAERKDEMAILETGYFKGAAKTWLGFLSADETNAANSVYTGDLMV